MAFVRGVNLRDVMKIDVGAEGVRIEFRDGTRKFVGGESGREVLAAFRRAERLKSGGSVSGRWGRSKIARMDE